MRNTKLEIGNVSLSLYLGLTAKTCHKKSDIVIEKSRESIQHQYEFAEYPPSDIRNLIEYKNCPKSRRTLVEMNITELLQRMK